MSQTVEYVLCRIDRTSVAVRAISDGSENVPRAIPQASSTAMIIRFIPFMNDLSLSAGENVESSSADELHASSALLRYSRSFPGGSSGFPSRPVLKASSLASTASSPPSNSHNSRPN